MSNVILIEPILKVEISVKEAMCPRFDCYWPRACEESFIPSRNKKTLHWVCNEQLTTGCPKNPTVQKSGALDNMEDDPKQKKVKTPIKKAVKKIVENKPKEKKTFKIIRK